jgi:hypothetical protein
VIIGVLRIFASSRCCGRGIHLISRDRQDQETFLFPWQNASKLGQTRQQPRSQRGVNLHVLQFQSKSFMIRRHLLSIGWKPERLFASVAPAEIVVEPKNLVVISQSAPGAQIGSDQFQKLPERRFVDVVTDPLKYDEGNGWKLSQLALKLGPRTIVEVDRKI